LKPSMAIAVLMTSLALDAAQEPLSNNCLSTSSSRYTGHPGFLPDRLLVSSQGSAAALTVAVFREKLPGNWYKYVLAPRRIAHEYTGSEFLSCSFETSRRGPAPDGSRPQGLCDYISPHREDQYASCRRTNWHCTRPWQVLNRFSGGPHQSCGRDSLNMLSFAPSRLQTSARMQDEFCPYPRFA